MVIKINVAEKIAAAINSPVIVCGNSDYIINFTFDEEWENYYVKTARFIFVINGEQKYQEVTFNGTECNVPILQNITEVKVGVYAGELHTTTPARIDCKKSVLCAGGTHEEPPEDIYNQLVEEINDAVEMVTEAEENAQQAEENAQQANENAQQANENAQQANENAQQAAATANSIYVDFNQLKTDAERLQALKNIIEQNKGYYFSFWIGTQAEYETLETKENNVLYLFTDGDEEEQVKNIASKIANEVFEQQKDYIIEQGTSGIWNYRKWNNGMCECWGGGGFAVTEVIPSTMEVTLYSQAFRCPLPFEVIGGTITGTVGNLAYIASAGIEDNHACFHICRDNLANNFTYWVNLSVHGRWK